MSKYSLKPTLHDELYLNKELFLWNSTENHFKHFPCWASIAVKEKMKEQIGDIYE